MDSFSGEDTVQRAATDVQAAASNARSQSWEKAQHVQKSAEEATQNLMDSLFKSAKDRVEDDRSACKELAGLL